MLEQEARRSRLVQALRDIGPEKRKRLEELKAEGRLLREREDVIWYQLLSSFATMGNSRGWRGLFGDPSLADAVSYDSLSGIDAAERTARIESVFRKAKIRMPARKAEWLATNFEKIEVCGGLSPVRKEAMSLPSRDEKLRFLKTFEGVGEKYARNIWMDLYDPAFRDSVAVDERIKSVTEELGYQFPPYSDHEDFYREIAAEAGLEAWEVDRLLYWFKPEFLQAIQAGDGTAANAVRLPDRIGAILRAFDSLSQEDRHEVLAEMLRRTSAELAE